MEQRRNTIIKEVTREELEVIMKVIGFLQKINYGVMTIKITANAANRSKAVFLDTTLSDKINLN